MRTNIASAALSAIAGLHVAWGLGASWPRIDRDPASPWACFAVAGLLGVAAGLVAGRTELIAPGSSSEGFRSMDRRVYSPLCLTLAALSLPRD